MDWLEFLDEPKYDAIVDALIVFGISLITELIAVPGIPAPLELYHSGLVGFLAFLIFFAKKRGIQRSQQLVLPYVGDEE